MGQADLQKVVEHDWLGGHFQGIASLRCTLVICASFREALVEGVQGFERVLMTFHTLNPKT